MSDSLSHGSSNVNYGFITRSLECYPGSVARTRQRDINVCIRSISLIGLADGLKPGGVMKRSIAVPISGRPGPHLAADTAPGAPAPDQPIRAVDISECVSLFDFETAAQQCLPHATWEYFNSGVADEITLGWNRSTYDHMRLRPQVLVDVSKLDTSIELLGRRLPHPILLAPAADQRMLHPEGEVATARAAGNSS